MTLDVHAVGLCASPGGPSSRSGALLDLALARLADHGGRVERCDLALLPADALLGRVPARQVDAVRDAVTGADLVLVATPIYRATYSGLLKVFFDLLSAEALAGTVAIPIAVGGSAAHQLALDHGLRPLLASVGALVVATGLYATPEDLAGNARGHGLHERIERAVDEALSLVNRAAARASIDRRAASSSPLVSHER